MMHQLKEIYNLYASKCSCNKAFHVHAPTALAVS